MSTTIKTGWLKDKNGDKFAPKTLASQVQTNDGILLEDKIQQDIENKITIALNSTKDYTDTEIANLVNSAPETLDTLGELAAAFEEHADIIEVLNEAITNKTDKTYVDEAINQVETNANDYTDGKILEEIEARELGDENTLNAAKTYVDE
jgi:hypothetical protein